MIGPLLVAFVESVELRHDDPDRECEGEQYVLRRKRHVIDARCTLPDLGDRERGSEADEVGHQQHPPDEPASPGNGCSRSATRDQAHRALVDNASDRITGRQILHGRHNGIQSYDCISPVRRPVPVDLSHPFRLGSRGERTPGLAQMHVLYSYPDVVGKPGIGVAALQNVLALADEGVDVTLVCASLGPRAEIDTARPVISTLALGSFRVPHRALGIDRAYRYHDRKAGDVLGRLAGEVDLVHTWPRAVMQTAAAAHHHGIPVVREVSNTHTAHAYEVVAAEHARLGVAVPPGHSHAYDPGRLALEEAEYEASDLLLVPSEHSRQTFLDRGFSPDRLAPHAYGFDPKSSTQIPGASSGRARSRSCSPPAASHARGCTTCSRRGTTQGSRPAARKLVVCGEFIPGYREAVARCSSIRVSTGVACRRSRCRDARERRVRAAFGRRGKRFGHLRGSGVRCCDSRFGSRGCTLHAPRRRARSRTG